jgi:hypothetical protein
MMPLDENLVWTYRVQARIKEDVTELRSAEEIAVAGTRGRRMDSEFGESRLAWKDGDLVAEMLGEVSYTPALPIYLGNDQLEPFSWEGLITIGDKAWPAAATITSEPESKEVLGIARDTVRVDHRIEVGEDVLTITSWFLEDVGIVEQVQRKNDEFEMSLHYEGGP